MLILHKATALILITSTSLWITAKAFVSKSNSAIIRHSDCVLPIYASSGKTQPQAQLIKHDKSSTKKNKSRHKRNQQQYYFRTTNTRSLAVLALMQTSIIGNKSNNNKAVTHLKTNSDYTSLEDDREKSFARKLVSVTQSRLGQIDKVLTHCCDSNYPPSRKTKNKYSIMVQAALRIGVAQILFMDIPGFAAVKETVEVLKKSQSSRSELDNGGTQRHHVPISMIKFTNAVLRKVNREGHNILQNHTCLTDNASPWLVKEWENDWGKEKTMQIVEQLFNEDSNDHIDLTLNLSHKLSDTERDVERGKLIRAFSNVGGNISNLNENIEDCPILLLPNGSLRIKRNGVVSNWPFYEEGKWWVQDVSATLPAIALCKTLKERHGDVSGLHVVDMCAAPGGKTAQLLLGGFGRVTAVESNAKRSRRLVENLKRLQLQDKCQVIVSKGQELVPMVKKEEEEGDTLESVVDGILVDVPCSATGTASKRPDVLCKDSNIEHLIEVQEVLANHCADNIISVGGVMVYATCSLLKAESEDQVRKLINRGDETKGRAVLQTIPFVNGEIKGFDNAIDESGWLRVLPGTLGGDLNSCDGFFVARLLRVE